MDANTLIAVTAVFALAGVVKGVIGLGLPTISMGLLAVVMPPAQAASILLLPSLITNLVQMGRGPALHGLARRLWPMLGAATVGTVAGSGWLSGPMARIGVVLLGITLLAYAAIGLLALRFSLSRAQERWVGPVVGLTTGLVTAATGVFVIPAVPYLQALDLSREDLVRALGLCFLVSTVALAANLALSGALSIATGWPAAAALAAALAGMGIGQIIRDRLSAAAFRTAFFAGLGLLGAYLVLRTAMA